MQWAANFVERKFGWSNTRSYQPDMSSKKIITISPEKKEHKVLRGWSGRKDIREEEGETRAEVAREKQRTAEAEVTHKEAQKTTPAETQMLSETEQQQQPPPTDNKSVSEPEQCCLPCFTNTCSSPGTCSKKGEWKEKPTPPKGEEKKGEYEVRGPKTQHIR